MQQSIVGDVGQVAGKNIINSGPQQHLSNIVNIKVRDLPRETYKEVIGSLDPSINRMGEGASSAAAEHTPTSFCALCTKRHLQFRQIWLALGVMFALIMVTSIKILFFSVPIPVKPESIYPIKHRCDFENRSYSIGSLFVMPNHRQSECIFDVERGIAYWVVSKLAYE